MRGASFGAKAWFVALAFAAPIALWGISGAIDYASVRDFTQGELQGVSQLQAYWPLNHALLLTRNASRASAGGFDAASDLEQSKRSAEAAFLTFAPALARTSGSVPVLKSFNTLKSKWDATKGAASPLEAEGKSTIYAPISAVSIELVQQIADDSGIILDPDIDTLYLGLLATQVLPDLLENLGQIRSWGTYLGAKADNISYIEYSQARQRYAVWDANVQSQIALYRRYVNKVAAYNPSTRQQLDLAFLDHAEAFRKLALEAVMNEAVQSPAFLWTQGGLVFDETSSRYDTLLPTLRILLEHRLQVQQTKYWTLSAIAGVLLLVAAYLFSNFFRCMVRDMAQQKRDEETLRQAMHEAEQAAVAKSQFLANMSHEIRTPMNAVLGMLKLLQGTDLTSRQFDYVGKSEGAAKSLLGLLNDILDFSKIDAGKMELDPQPFFLDRLMRDLSVILSVNVGSKPVEVLFDIDPQMPSKVVGDSMRLQQVLINLSGNAIKFTQQGEVVVQIKVISRTSNQAVLRFAVQDTGIGIAPDKQKHIFSGFSQAESSTTRRFGGTGLGLSISKRLVDLMGGALELQSAPDKGSTFHFTLTLEARAAEQSEPPHAKHQRMEKLNVLVVDDNPVARELLARMAKSWGWRVDAAEDGAQAIELVDMRNSEKDYAYQAIFMDWEMPGMDGWETIARINQIWSGAKLPISVMVSAHSRESLSARSAQEQALLSAFLVKPVTPFMLYDAVADALGGNSQMRQAVRSAVKSAGRLLGMRLLVVEDNPINQQVARELLKSEGALVDMADNGLAGVTAVAQAATPFSAILMDLQMPVMDGFAATRAIRNELGQMELPIIAMTANAMASDREECLAAGMNDHIGKPFDLDHLVSVLLKHTGSKTSSHSPAHTPQSNKVPAPLTSVGSASSVIQAQQAIERIGGMKPLYASLLREFLVDLDQVVPEYQRLLAASMFAEAARHMHTLKGTSATLGALELSALALVLEKQCKGPFDAHPKDYRMTELIALIESTHTSAIQIINELEDISTPQMQVSATTAPMPRDTSGTHTLVNESISELMDLLSTSDLAALDQFREMRPNLDSNWTNEAAAIDSALSRLDFDAALDACRHLEVQLRTSAY